MTSDEEYWQKLLEEQAQFEAANPDPRMHPAGPLHQFAAREGLDRERARYESGDKMALLAAIRICANHDLPLPPWASEAYISRYDEVLNCRLDSWDDAFGKPYPGKQVNRLKQRRNLRYAVYMRIKEIREQDGHYESQPDGDLKLVSKTPIDEALFERVGQELHIGKTLCSELYYSVERPISKLPRKS